MPFRLDARDRRFRRTLSRVPRHQARGRGGRRGGGARDHRRRRRARRPGARGTDPAVRSRRSRARSASGSPAPRSRRPRSLRPPRRSTRWRSRATASRPITAGRCRNDERFTDALGVELGWRWTAIEAVGLYVPGGTAGYPSSVLMNAVPAKVAGVPRIVMVVPAPGGKLNPLVLAAAKLAGIDEVYRVGGAQAVAALAYGTATIAPVAKIVGPGNAYVAAAKRRVFGQVGIDMIAGPVRGADRRRRDRQSGLDRRRSAGPGRARCERAVDPDHRQAALADAVEKAVERAARDAAARRHRGRVLARFRRHHPGRRPRRRGAAGRLASRPSIWRSRARCRAARRRIRNAGAIFLGAHTPGGDRRLCRRLEPRAADRALGALLVGPRRARLHEAHLDPQMRARAAALRSARRRSRSARPKGSTRMRARSPCASIRDDTAACTRRNDPHASSR